MDFFSWGGDENQASGAAQPRASADDHDEVLTPVDVTQPIDRHELESMMRRLALGPPRGWDLLWDQDGLVLHCFTDYEPEPISGKVCGMLMGKLQVPARADVALQLLRDPDRRKLWDDMLGDIQIQEVRGHELCSAQFAGMMGLSSARFFQWYLCQGFDRDGNGVAGSLQGAWSYALLLRPAAPRWDELMDAPAPGTTMDVSYGIVIRSDTGQPRQRCELSFLGRVHYRTSTLRQWVVSGIYQQLIARYHSNFLTAAESVSATMDEQEEKAASKSDRMATAKPSAVEYMALTKPGSDTMPSFKAQSRLSFFKTEVPDTEQPQVARSSAPGQVSQPSIRRPTAQPVEHPKPALACGERKVLVDLEQVAKDAEGQQRFGLPRGSGKIGDLKSPLGARLEATLQGWREQRKLQVRTQAPSTGIAMQDSLVRPASAHTSVPRPASTTQTWLAELLEGMQGVKIQPAPWTPCRNKADITQSDENKEPQAKDKIWKQIRLLAEPDTQKDSRPLKAASEDSSVEKRAAAPDFEPPEERLASTSQADATRTESKPGDERRRERRSRRSTAVHVPNRVSLRAASKG